MREWPDDNRRWVIAYNMQSLVTPIRHIIELHDVNYNEAEFAALYYERYNKIEGDAFVSVVSTKKMREEEARIVTEYNDAISKEDRRKNWKEHCAKSAEKGFVTE
jgi:hypothetical protein